jgi:hypothetical protein
VETQQKSRKTIVMLTLQLLKTNKLKSFEAKNNQCEFLKTIEENFRTKE